MEIEEIKNCWKEDERQITEKMEVNKEASFKKLRTSFERIKMKRFYQVTLMCISTPLIILFVVLLGYHVLYPAHSSIFHS